MLSLALDVNVKLMISRIWHLRFQLPVFINQGNGIACRGVRLQWGEMSLSLSRGETRESRRSQYCTDTCYPDTVHAINVLAVNETFHIRLIGS
jgi:hypothetical protein